MAARAETDDLRRIVHLGSALVVLPLEPSQVHQHWHRRGLARQRRDHLGLFRIVDHCRLHHDTGHGFTCQMSEAYSPIVRSLENLPELATFRIALRAQAPGSAYRLQTPASASR